MLNFVRLLIIIISPLILITALIFLRLLIRLIKGDRFKKRTGKIKKKRAAWKRIFIDFPRTFADDMFKRDPDGFPDYGLHLICGEQGAGKTITLAYLLNKYREEYPLAKIRTNFNYKNQAEGSEGEINHYKDLIFNDNGIYGQIDVLDEVQNWFNSLQSKDFPIEMIQEITQQRKQRKVIFGTSQVFNRVAKPIREQVNYLYQPFTICGCLTVVRVTKPKMNEDAAVEKQRFVRMFFFVHNDEIRNSFDTYAKIERLADGGLFQRDWGSQTKK